jgi:hypothetical protein
MGSIRQLDDSITFASVIRTSSLCESDGAGHCDLPVFAVIDNARNGLRVLEYNCPQNQSSPVHAGGLLISDASWDKPGPPFLPAGPGGC